METDDDTMLVAFNTNQVSKTQTYFGSGLEPYGGEKFQCEIVKETNPNKHAEMKILDELWRQRATVTYGSYIGITQPCCMLCAGAMVAASYNAYVLGYHTKAVTNWVAPQAISRDGGNLKKFLGDTAYAEVSGDQDDIDRLLQLLSQQHSGWDSV